MTNESIVYVAALMEYVARATKNRPSDIAKYVGLPELCHLTEYAAVNHCLPMAQVASEVIGDNQIPTGSFDAVGQSEYRVPDYKDIGKVYARLVEDTASGDNDAQRLFEILCSPISDEISNFNSSLYYSSRSEVAYRFRETQLEEPA